MRPKAVGGDKTVPRTVPRAPGRSNAPREHTASGEILPASEGGSAAEHVFDRVPTRGSADREPGRCKSAAREQVPTGGAVRQLEPLTVSHQVHGVIPDHVSAAHGQDADLIARPRAHFAVAAGEQARLWADLGDG